MKIGIFDFDGTLTQESLPKYWIPDTDEAKQKITTAFAKYSKADGETFIDKFFDFFMELSGGENARFHQSKFAEWEEKLKYNPDVHAFFRNSSNKNYIISGGLSEFLNNLEIAGFFAGIYGTHAEFDKDGFLTGMGEFMSDETKIKAIQDILQKNSKKDCQGVIFVGDGLSDEAAMRYVHNNGGKVIFVCQPVADELTYATDLIYKKLMSEKIVDAKCVADYKKNSELYLRLAEF